jgi:hypothetical protein
MLLLLFTLAMAAPERGLVLAPEVAGRIDDGVRTTVGDRVAFAVADAARFAVLSTDEMRSLSNLAAERQAAGCDDDACMTELAGALDARFVVRPRIARSGREVLLTIVVFDATTAQVIGRGSGETTTLDNLGPLVVTVVDEALADADLLRPGRAPSVASGPKPLVIAGGAGLGVAALGVASGAIAFLVAESTLQSPTDLTTDEYRRWQGVGRAGVYLGGGLGLVAGVAGGALLALGLKE